MSKPMTASDRLRIARELLRRTGADNLRDMAVVARALVALEMDVSAILQMPEIIRLPDVRRWLAHELGRAIGVIA